MKETPTVKLLKAARALLAKPNHWYQGWFRGTNYTRAGLAVTAYCALGAIREVSIFGSRGSVRAKSLLNKATREVTGGEYTLVSDFNDGAQTRKKDILAVYDKAIEMAGGKS